MTSLDAIWACLLVWVMVGGSSSDWVMNWQEQDVVVVDGGGDCKRCVRAEFKRIRKMKCENKSKNDYFCTSKGMVQFFKNGSKWSLKMSKKWVKNGYCEQPYYEWMNVANYKYTEKLKSKNMVKKWVRKWQCKV